MNFCEWASLDYNVTNNAVIWGKAGLQAESMRGLNLEREIPRPAGEGAGLRNDAFQNNT
jgi:hypothetical protein